MKCPICDINMKQLLTSFYCPNDCDPKADIDPRDMMIDGVHFFCDKIGATITNANHSIVLSRDNMVGFCDRLKRMIKSGIDSRFSLNAGSLLFQYLKHGDYLRITYDQDIFHTFFERDVLKIISFLENGNKVSSAP